MKASEASLLKFLHKSPQLIVPIYQRTYSWTERECSQIWSDIVRVGQNDDVSAHFVGSIVYIQQDLYQVTEEGSLLVIDGQQRLTTISLILEALARHVGEAEPFPGFSAAKLRQYYLLNPLEAGERHFKLLLTQTDRDTVKALVKQKPEPSDASVKVMENFAYFCKQIETNQIDIEAICRGLNKLLIVDISLTRGQDNPQLIFESMNSTGKELSQADLIRNFVLMGLEPDHQANLYNFHWRPMEIAFGQEAYGDRFDGFMRDYLTFQTGEIPNVRKVYEAFKQFSGIQSSNGASVDDIVKDIQRFAGHYCSFALAGREDDTELSMAFQDLRELKVEVAFPLLLELYDDYTSGILSHTDFLEIIRLIESYVFRRAVCGIPTNALNKVFATFGRAIRKSDYLESARARLLLLQASSRFPTNEEFSQELAQRDLYNFPRRSYFFRRLENFGRKEPIEINEYTIEHIMPQNPALSEDWRTSIGPDWQRVHQLLLHTLGNLTLTGYNSEYGDKSFITKRDMDGGFRYSPLALNQGLGQVSVWDEAAIHKRAERLASRAAEVWKLIVLSPAQLESYRPKALPKTSFSLDDYGSLQKASSLRKLFDDFRSEVLALDPNVTEEFFKIYIAYKAETNFVDVDPQAKALLLTLNMPFYDVYDPRSLCKDMTGIGKHGNGDVQFRLHAHEDLPYALGLVRQSLERQLGDQPPS